MPRRHRTVLPLAFIAWIKRIVGPAAHSATASGIEGLTQLVRRGPGQTIDSTGYFWVCRGVWGLFILFGSVRTVIWTTVGFVNGCQYTP